ncbi:GNAT family N-acetyltransferase [Halobaculum lipolyticum]|uniref:GNAT family N-acetyltransferase n=1 Tax=Halobaculum lipolyticum TaxID=3032001 RepID=A0ABD5W9E7_9EURY|nr:GNAT family protein [Halobaculum sp. DT31]
MFPDRILTDRLRLDRHDAAVDALAFYEHVGERRSDTIAAECEWLNWSPHAHPAESAGVLESFREGWEERDSATYAVVPREGEDGAGTYAGNTGLSFDWDRHTATLGIWLREPFWGRGYSGERAQALAALAFDRLDLELLAVEAFPENERSIRAIEKYVDTMGGREEGLIRNHLADQDGAVHDVRRFSIHRDEYAEAVGDDDAVTFVDDVDFGNSDGSGGSDDADD